jgi:hypothetical protein
VRTMLAARRSVGGNRHASQVKVARKGGFFPPHRCGRRQIPANAAVQLGSGHYLPAPFPWFRLVQFDPQRAMTRDRQTE